MYSVSPTFYPPPNEIPGYGAVCIGDVFMLLRASVTVHPSLRNRKFCQFFADW